MFRKIVAAAFIFAALGACKGSKEAYDKAFIEGWKGSFVKSCVGDNATDEKTAICNCVADKAVVELTVDQLSDIKYSTDYIKDTIIPECQQQ